MCSQLANNKKARHLSRVSLYTAHVRVLETCAYIISAHMLLLYDNYISNNISKTRKHVSHKQTFDNYCFLFYSNNNDALFKVSLKLNSLMQSDNTNVISSTIDNTWLKHILLNETYTKHIWIYMQDHTY